MAANGTAGGEALRAKLEGLGIDAETTLRMLALCNSGKASPPIASAKGLVGLDHPAVMDFRRGALLAMDRDELLGKLAELGLPASLAPAALPNGIGEGTGGNLKRDVLLRDADLRAIGVLLYGRAAYGILNGGSATSYADRKRNESISPELFSLYEGEFSSLAALAVGKPKALAPAYLNPDGSPGLSYLELKLRALALDALDFKRAGGQGPSPLPLFQMTSELTDPPLTAAFAGLESRPGMRELSLKAAYPLGKPELTGIQRMLAAFTPSEAGLPRGVFTEAKGQAGGVLPLPGGHGQNFAVLEGVYRKLLASGYRWAYLGNVDNLGSTVDPRALAVVALTGTQAGFDFSFRTPLDTKGGILVETEGGKITCADLGQAISFEAARDFEKRGLHVLFNCATGIFDLEWLVANLEKIRDGLPIRLSDQNKDLGKYSQAEQNTWEIMGMLDDFKVFAVEKPKRFLSAKMLMETVMMSGVPLDKLKAKAAEKGDQSLAAFAEESRALSAGLAALLEGEYGLKLQGGKYLPGEIG